MTDKLLNVLIGCEFSGLVRDAFIAHGHDAVSCDLLDSERPGPHIKGDVLDSINDGFDMMIAFPPCTYLAVSGNKWMKPEYQTRFPNRQQQRKDAIDFFMQLVNAPIDKICIENPVGIMSTEYRKPDQYIQPYHFGHPETKKTGLWLKGLPKLNPTKIVAPEWIIGKRDGKRYSKIHYMTARSFGKDINRQKERSRSYTGIAEAMSSQWSDIGFAKYCKCGRQLIGNIEKENNQCSYCARPGVDQ